MYFCSPIVGAKMFFFAKRVIDKLIDATWLTRKYLKKNFCCCFQRVEKHLFIILVTSSKQRLKIM